MKKLSCIILILVLVVAMFTACGGNSQPAGTGGQGNDSPNSNVVEPGTTGNQTGSESNCKEEDFATESLGDGKCALKAYYGDASVVVVPSVIRGETVVEIVGVGTTGIKKVVLPDTVEVIAYQAFNYCPDLEEIVFGKGLKEVGYFAFNACDSLKEIIFPEGLTTLSELPFGICANLKKVYIPASAINLGGLFFYAETMPNLVIVTPAGSAAEKLALENKLPVVNQ